MIFYLSLILIKSKYIINYKYTIDYINQLHKLNENKNNNSKLRKIMFSKIILVLIDYFKGFDEYNENNQPSINSIKNKNIDIIKNNIEILDKFKLKEKDFINLSIEEIYIEIIKILLHENNDYKKVYDIINQLNLEKIDITNFIFKEISKMLSNDESFIKKKITTRDDFFNTDKIEFYCILLKYIFKNSYYIYQIPFLNDTRTFILKSIKSIITDNKNKEKLVYLINTITGLKYYFNHFDIDIIQKYSINDYNDKFVKDQKMNENFKKPTNNLFEEYSQIYEIEVQLHNQARSTNIENSNKLEEQDKNITEITSTKKDNQTNSNKDINVENNKDKKKDYKINFQYEMVQYIEKISGILEKIVIHYTYNKEEKNDIKIILGEGKKITDNINYDNLIALKELGCFSDMDKEQLIKYSSFVKMVNFIQKIDEFFSNEYKDKNFGKISLMLKHEKLYGRQNKNGIYNITCNYGIYSQNKSIQLNYKDENILLNGYSQGFLALICEINEIL